MLPDPNDEIGGVANRSAAIGCCLNMPCLQGLKLDVYPFRRFGQSGLDRPSEPFAPLSPRISPRKRAATGGSTTSAAVERESESHSARMQWRHHHTAVKRDLSFRFMEKSLDGRWSFVMSQSRNMRQLESGEVSDFEYSLLGVASFVVVESFCGKEIGTTSHNPWSKQSRSKS